MKPLPLPPVDDLLTKLNSAIRGGFGDDIRFRRAFADRLKETQTYRVGYRQHMDKPDPKKRRREMRYATFTASELDAMSNEQIRWSITVQCGFDMPMEDKEETANEFARNAILSVLD